MKHQIRINQAYHVERWAIVEVEAETVEDAAELIASGRLSGPGFDDPRWTSEWKLEGETVD